MEKVKITQEQNRAISELMEHPYNNTKDELLKEHAELGGFVTLNDLDIDLPLLAKVLYGRYEVESKFKVGDWVKSRHGIGTGKITKIDKMGYYTYFGMIAASDDIRHATPQEIAEEKERRWWAKHDRGVWEIREGDVLEYLGDPLIIDWFDSEDICFRRGKSNPVKYTENLDYVKEHFKVFCFAEDRQDA